MRDAWRGSRLSRMAPRLSTLIPLTLVLAIGSLLVYIFHSSSASSNRLSWQPAQPRPNSHDPSLSSSSPKNGWFAPLKDNGAGKEEKQRYMTSLKAQLGPYIWKLDMVTDGKAAEDGVRRGVGGDGRGGDLDWDPVKTKADLERQAARKKAASSSSGENGDADQNDDDEDEDTISDSERDAMADLSGPGGKVAPGLKSLKDDEWVMVIPVNHGMLGMVYNLLCSLRRIRSRARPVIWALDLEAVHALQAYQLRHPRTAHHFGIYHDPNLFAVSSFERGGTDNYWRMMSQRPKFFLSLLREAGLGVLFVDADIVFYSDPWEIVRNSHGADFVMSTDTRNFFDLLPDPYEGQPIVPRICAGLFAMRSNANSIKVYELMAQMMAAGEFNDQYALDLILNDARHFNTTLVGTLPRGLPRTRQPPTPEVRKKLSTLEKLIQIQSDREAWATSTKAPDSTKEPSSNPPPNPLTVNLLSQTAYTSGAVYTAHRTDHYPFRVEKLAAGRKGTVHGNWWGSDKFVDFKNYGLWLLNEQDECVLEESADRDA